MKIFNHLDLPELPSLSRKNIDGKRMYCTDSGDRYPSITTVLSCRGKKGLYEWRQRVGSVEADKVSKKASTRGTKIHKICEDYINNEPLPELTLVEQETWNTFKPVVERIDNIHHSVTILVLLVSAIVLQSLMVFYLSLISRPHVDLNHIR